MEPYHVHETRLRKSCSFFKEKLECTKQHNNKKTVFLPNDDPEAFDMFASTCNVQLLLVPVYLSCTQTNLLSHSPLQELSANIHFPGLGTEDKNVKRMNGSIK